MRWIVCCEEEEPKRPLAIQTGTKESSVAPDLEQCLAKFEKKGVLPSRSVVCDHPVSVEIGYISWGPSWGGTELGGAAIDDSRE